MTFLNLYIDRSTSSDDTLQDHQLRWSDVIQKDMKDSEKKKQNVPKNFEKKCQPKEGAIQCYVMGVGRGYGSALRMCPMQ